MLTRCLRVAVVLFELAALRTPFASPNMYKLCDEVLHVNELRGNDTIAD